MSNMFANITTKLALRKVGITSNTFNFSSPTESKKPTDKNAPPGSQPGLDDMYGSGVTWPSWMSVKALPLTVQPWLSPPPPPIPVATEPKIGDLAPIDRDRKLTVGGGKNVLVVFLRCVGCAFAQKMFLQLRTLANKYPNNLTCVAVSHSSEAATRKWVEIIGGAWNVQVVIDEDRAIYAAWGLGVGSIWYVLNPNTQVQAWKESGWLGGRVAGAMKRAESSEARNSYQTGGTGVIDAEGPTTVMGNKWQQHGAWAIDGRGTIVWGGKALAADDVLDLELGTRALGL